MGLYLCVFRSEESDEEIEGVEIGGYDDFDSFRSVVSEMLEGGEWASRFPVLMGHSDSDGAWTPSEAGDLEREVLTIAGELARLPARPFASGWPEDVAAQLDLTPETLLDVFIDVDGEPLLERLVSVAKASQTSGQDIWLQ